MLTKLKINFLKYFLITGLVTLALIVIIAETRDDVYGILIVYFAAVANQFMLVKFVREFFTANVARRKESIDKLEVAGLFILKIVVLLSGITLGVHFMGSRVIFPVLNYVFQMFILTFSLKKNGKSE